MIKVYQTKFKGIDVPREEQGNCFQACLASLLEIPLESAFDWTQYSEHRDDIPIEEQPWYAAFNEWLIKFGLASIYLQDYPSQLTALNGYYIVAVKSNTLKNGENHCVIINKGKLAHDPNPKSNAKGSTILGIYLLVPLDMAKAKTELLP